MRYYPPQPIRVYQEYNDYSRAKILYQIACKPNEATHIDFWNFLLLPVWKQWDRIKQWIDEWLNYEAFKRLKSKDIIFVERVPDIEYKEIKVEQQEDNFATVEHNIAANWLCRVRER